MVLRLVEYTGGSSVIVTTGTGHPDSHMTYPESSKTSVWVIQLAVPRRGHRRPARASMREQNPWRWEGCRMGNQWVPSQQDLLSGFTPALPELCELWLILIFWPWFTHSRGWTSVRLQTSERSQPKAVAAAAIITITTMGGGALVNDKKEQCREPFFFNLSFIPTLLSIWFQVFISDISLATLRLSFGN